MIYFILDDKPDTNAENAIIQFMGHSQLNYITQARGPAAIFSEKLRDRDLFRDRRRLIALGASVTVIECVLYDETRTASER